MTVVLLETKPALCPGSAFRPFTQRTIFLSCLSGWGCRPAHSPPISSRLLRQKMPDGVRHFIMIRYLGLTGARLLCLLCCCCIFLSCGHISLLLVDISHRHIGLRRNVTIEGQGLIQVIDSERVIFQPGISLS